jgi:hypothetical protein
VSCKNKSPQVYPVILSSGNTRTFTPCCSASSIIFIVCSPFQIQSATFTTGVAAATLMNPSFILKSSISSRLLF